MHEILTVQLGQRANYLATHFWNAQESYHTFPPDPPSVVDHDLHFRPGIGADGSETYLPRTVIYDLKGGFGSLRKINELYEIEGGVKEGDGVWKGRQVIQTEPPIPPSPYHVALSQGLSPPALIPSTVRYWSDFSHTYFHPRSIVQLNDYALNSSLQPFERYETGDELFDSLDKEHDLLDRDLRLWAEECDQMQGLQIFSGIDDAWGGFAARYVERIRDEYGKVGIWVWGIEGAPGAIEKNEKKLLRAMNIARSVHDISTRASLFTPISLPRVLPPYISLDRGSSWHTSAVLSSAMESLTTPSRLRNEGQNRLHSLFDFEAALNSNGNQRIARLQASFVDPATLETDFDIQTDPSKGDHRFQNRFGEAQMRAIEEDEALKERNDGLDIDFLTEAPRLFANTGGRTLKSFKPPHKFGDISTFRRQLPEHQNTSGHLAHASHQDDYDDVDLARKRRRIANLPHLLDTQVNLGYSLLPTFPAIFSFPSLQQRTSLFNRQCQQQSQTQDRPRSVAVKASLSTTTEIKAKLLMGLREVVLRVGSVEDREGLANGLGEIAEAYEEGWEGSDGSEDDDI
ncbi:Protein misato 1 [Agyrium rufum]|nr:Protein misato 1 [Agyrium rufum]